MDDAKNSRVEGRVHVRSTRSRCDTTKGGCKISQTQRHYLPSQSDGTCGGKK